MHSITCVYLHGFLSNGNSHKGQWFAKQAKLENSMCTESDEGVFFQDWLTPSYPIASPQASVSSIENRLKALLNTPETTVVLMGSSMGGFYAQFLGQKYQLPYVLINPALNPRPIFEANRGEHVNPSTEESVCIDEDYIQQIETYQVAKLNLQIPILLLIDKGDELIDIPFAVSQHPVSQSKCQVQLFEGGDHAFQHLEQAWPMIKAFMQTIHAE